MVSGGEGVVGIRACAVTCSRVRGSESREFGLELGLTCDYQMCTPAGLCPLYCPPSRDVGRFHSIPEQHHQMGHEPFVHTNLWGNILHSINAYTDLCEENREWKWTGACKSEMRYGYTFSRRAHKNPGTIVVSGESQGMAFHRVRQHSLSPWILELNSGCYVEASSHTADHVFVLILVCTS